MFWILAAAHAAPLSTCATRYDTAALVASVDAAEKAFTELDGETLQAARTEAQERLGCVQDRLDPVLIARIHRMEALAAFVSGAQGRVAQALAGALLAEPGHEIPTALVPEEHAIRDQRRFATQLLREGAPRRLTTQFGGLFEVDGDAQHRLSTSHAGVVQQLDGGGALVETRYVWPEDPLGTWDGSNDPAPQKPTTRRTTPYLAVTGGFLGASTPVQDASPGPFGGGAFNADLGVVVPFGKILGVAASAGYTAFPENKQSVVGRMGRAHAGLFIGGTRGGVELGPTLTMSTFTTPNYDARGLAFGLGLGGYVQMFTLGPVGVGLHSDMHALLGGTFAVGTIGAGLHLSWEGNPG